MVSLIAAIHGLSKLEALERVVEESAAAQKRLDRILSKDVEVYEAWKSQEAGYIAFHTATARYKLHELEL